MKEQLFFAHANGFPAEVYGEFFESLKNYDIQYIPILAHGTYKLETSYDDVVPEIIDYIESNYKEPIWGIGHSFGASLLTSAAEQKPHLFKGLILIDPVILSKTVGRIMRILQLLNINHLFHPLAKKSRKRSDHFPSKEFAADKLRNKTIFKRFSLKTFNNYIEYGFKKTQNGVTLRFDKEIETKIFILHPQSKKPIKLDVPSYFLYATEGDIADSRPIESITYLYPNTKFIPLNGGHLFPLEEPKKCSKLVDDILNSH